MSREMVQSAFSQVLISGSLVHESSFQSLQDQAGVSVHPTVVMVVSMDRYPEKVEQNDLPRSERVGRKLTQLLSRCIPLPFTWLWLEPGVLAVLIEVFDEEAKHGDRRDSTAHRLTHHPLLQSARKLQTLMRTESGKNTYETLESNLTVSIGFGQVYTNPYELHLSFQEAVSALRGRFFQGNERIYLFASVAPIEHFSNHAISIDTQELLALVRMGDPKSIRHQAEKLLLQLKKACHSNEELFKAEVLNILISVSKMILESGASSTDILLQSAELAHTLQTTIRYDRFVEKVCQYCIWLASHMDETEQLSLSVAVRKAMQYIKEHHRDVVTLEAVAKHCCVSKYHLSHKFKCELDIGIVEYLHRLRVEKAVFYLQSTDWSMQQIASMIGFEDANYFSRIFRKHMNCTPRTFRTTKSY